MGHSEDGSRDSDSEEYWQDSMDESDLFGLEESEEEEEVAGNPPRISVEEKSVKGYACLVYTLSERE